MERIPETTSTRAAHRKQPSWEAPTNRSFRTGLMVNNSLTSSLEEFVPAKKNCVKWYICGPTVYDSPHLGHARTYLSFDIIRRIMENYFGYNIEFCMNITDIDDKIILKSRRNYLLENWKLQNLSSDASKALKDLNNATEYYLNKMSAELKQSHNVIVEEIGKSKNENFSATLQFLIDKYLKIKQIKIPTDSINSDSFKALVEEHSNIEDVLSEWLDHELGHTLEPSLLNQLTRDLSCKYEGEFMSDMQSIGVQPPDILTRVSEFIPQIIASIEAIVGNRYAYVTDGSVYFDTNAFNDTPGHFYAKLMPSHVGNAEMLREGEGALSSDAIEGKHSKNDFALWKRSKPGEPFWESPWGNGRPGWHIECSAMAGYVFGQQLDIHAGGIDLKFPHHDNEIAQSEALFNCHQWVNYFLHSGHLHIDKLKMSKSLKNFITIQEILKNNSARSLRLLFLMQPWDSIMNFQMNNPMEEAESKEKAWNDLFMRTRQLLSQPGSTLHSSQKWEDLDFQFNKVIKKTQARVHTALCNNFDTPQVIKHLIKLTTESNKYFSAEQKKSYLLNKSCRFITRILRIFGVLNEDYIGAFSSAANNSANHLTSVRPVIDAFTTFRTLVRKFALENKIQGNLGLLQLCDEVRNDIAPKLGIKIVDDSEFSYFMIDPEEQNRENLEAKIDKIRKKLEVKTKEHSKWLESSVVPEKYILEKYNVVYSDMINDNVALDDKNAISKKKLEKIYARQFQKNLKFKEKLDGEPDFIKSLSEQIGQLKITLSSLLECN